MKKLILTILCLGIVSYLVRAQNLQIDRQVIANAGGYSVSSNGNLSLSWTMGETIIETLSNGTLILTQGFQQPEPQETVAIEQISLEEIGLKVFPNPTNTEVIIQLTTPNELPLDAQLFT